MHAIRMPRFVAVLAVVIALFTATLATTTAIEHHVPPVSAGGMDCIVGVLVTGIEFISVLTAPAGVLRILGWGSLGITTPKTIANCQTVNLQSYIKQYTNCTSLIFMGILIDRNWHQYAGYKGVGSGGGGGCSGSW